MSEVATTQEEQASASFPAALLDSGLIFEDERQQIARANDLIQQGRATDATRLVDRIMNESAGFARSECLLVYARYLLARSRPFSAGRALRALLRRKPVDPLARVYYAEALADSGNLDRAQKLAEKMANAGGEGAVEAAKLYDSVSSITEGGEHTSAEVLQERLAQITNHDPAKLFATQSIATLDRLIREWIEADQLARADSAETWGYYLGEYCRRHLGAQWSWRRRIEDSTVRIPLVRGALELAPAVWAKWRLSRSEHRLSDLVRVLLRLKGAETKQLKQVLGPNSAEYAVVADPEGDPLSGALADAVTSYEAGESVTGLGLVIDCPFGRVRVPLVVESGEGQRLVLRWCAGSPEADFGRYLDMLALGPMGRVRWTIDSVEDGHRLYEAPDVGRRAALVARRLCGDDNPANARWAVAVAGSLLDTTLDGRLSSLSKVERLLVEDLRAGGQERWGDVFEDRFGLVFLLTCYVGEVVRRHYGGRWGADRITGEPTGPTAGLELGRVRFNLGALILKAFYGGPGRSFLPAVREYARRAQAESGAQESHHVFASE